MGSVTHEQNEVNDKTEAPSYAGRAQRLSSGSLDEYTLLSLFFKTLLSMLIRLVRLPLAPARVADFLRLFRQAESRIRQQPGCQHLELWQDADQPHTYCTYSHWHDAAALDVYRRSALFGEVWPATKQLLAAPAQAFSVVRVVEGA